VANNEINAIKKIRQINSDFDCHADAAVKPWMCSIGRVLASTISVENTKHNQKTIFS
jgi:hypothetical protein